MSKKSKKYTREELNERSFKANFPFAFPKLEKRSESVPSVVAQRWFDASHYFFFYNLLTTQNRIRRFLRAQPMEVLDHIAVGFEMEPADLVSEKRKKEGVIMVSDDRELIISEILKLVTV